MREIEPWFRRSISSHERGANQLGFEWIDCNDHQRSLVSFIRRGRNPDDVLLFVFNFTPIP